MHKLGVVIPAYNERENIVQLCQKTLEYDFVEQIIVVDDSKDDYACRLIQKLNNPRIQTVHRQLKLGRGSAVICGFEKLTQFKLNYYLEIDADFSHPPEQIEELLKVAVRDGLDMLIASRYLSGSRIINWPLSRRLFSKFSNILAKFTLSVPVSDCTNGYRLYSHRAALEIIKSCGQRGVGFIVLSEILVCLYYKGYKVSELPTTFTNRIRGESSLSFREVLNALRGLLKIYQYKKELLRSKAKNQNR